MIHRRHRLVVVIIYSFKNYRVTMYMYECLKQMLRSKDTFDFDHKLTIDMSHCRSEVCKLILTFQVAKIVQRKALDLRRERKVDQHSKPSDFLRETNEGNTSRGRTVF